ncbi:MAG: hypothetical protein AAF614_03240 [Chloroflexota bacterium]
MKHSQQQWVLKGIGAVTIILTLLIALNWFPALRGPDDWRWTYAIPGKPWRILLPAVVLLIYVAVILVWLRRFDQANGINGRFLPFLLFIFLTTPLIQLALLSANSPNVWQQLFYRTVSAGSSGVFSVGSTINSGSDFLASYPSLMPTFPVHPQRYPPGLPLLFYLNRTLWTWFPNLSHTIAQPLRLTQCLDFNLMRLPNETIATAVLQMSLPLINSLIVFPLYGLARRSIGHPAARWTVALYPIIPSFALWAGRWDQFYPLLTVLAGYLFYRGLTEEKRTFLFLAGLVLSFASFFSFGNIAILAPLGLWVLLWLFARPEMPSFRKDGISRAIIDGLIFAFGLASLWIIYQLRFGLGLREIWQVSMSFHLGLERSYWTWLGYHLYDFGLFLGIPLALLLFVALVKGTKQFRQPAAMLPLAFVIGLLLLDLSGTSRGEVARVWLFLTPFAVLSACWALQTITAQKQQQTFALILFLLAGQLLFFNTFLRVVNTGLEDPQVRQVLYEQPPLTEAVNAELGGQMMLAGFVLEETTLTSNTPLNIQLVWQGMQQMERPFTIFLHLLDPSGQLVAQQDNMPVQNSLPTTCWFPNEVVIDPYSLPLTADLSPGQYQLVTGAYWLETGQRLTQPSGQDHIPLTLIQIAE